jgi:hypothetical protein
MVHLDIADVMIFVIPEWDLVLRQSRILLHILQEGRVHTLEIWWVFS